MKEIFLIILILIIPVFSGAAEKITYDEDYVQRLAVDEKPFCDIFDVTVHLKYGRVTKEEIEEIEEMLRKFFPSGDIEIEVVYNLHDDILIFNNIPYKCSTFEY